MKYNLKFIFIIICLAIFIILNIIVGFLFYINYFNYNNNDNNNEKINLKQKIEFMIKNVNFNKTYFIFDNKIKFLYNNQQYNSNIKPYE